MLALLPAGFVLVYAFRAGGYFPSAIAWGVVLLGAILLAQLIAGRSPFHALDGLGRLALAALALLAGLTLLSAAWSEAPWRAVVEFDRLVLYLLAFAVFGSAGLTSERARLMVRALAVAIVLVCVAALLARLLPAVYPLAVELDGYGLDHPVTYANTLGLLAVLGMVLCLHMSADDGEPPAGQVLAAAGVPLLATTLVLTGSHGAVLAGVVGVMAYAVAARPPRLVAALVAVVPAAALAAAAALGARGLATADATSAPVLAEGRMVAVVVVLSMANAALLRWLARRFGGAVTAFLATLVAPRARKAVALAAAVTAIAVVGGLLLSGAELPDAGSAARVDHWRVALGGFADAPLGGNGAGTYELISERARGEDAAVRDAHSLGLETLAELGLAGFALLVIILACVVAGLVRRLGEPDRPLFGAVLAITLTWTAHAMIDWDWEMPVVTLPVFALCGTALGMRRAAVADGALLRAPGATDGRPENTRARTRATVALVLLVMAIAALVAISEIQLRSAVGAARAGDCRTVARAASGFPLGVRPEGRALLSRCEGRRPRRNSPRDL